MRPNQPEGRAGSKLPRHVAMIMDGNGRWATRRRLPRFAGHRAGVETAKEMVRACGEKGIDVLTLFAFSSENWRRPEEEVGLLMDLFVAVLDQQVKQLHDNNIRLRIIGDRKGLHSGLRERIDQAEFLTEGNTGQTLVIAANYGGRWDCCQAVRRVAGRVQRGDLALEDIDEQVVQAELALDDLPEPDLFIRTGGERRVSNFLLWHLAYTELYFTDTLWPDFDRSAFEGALAYYAAHQRRFGRTGEQVAQAQRI